MIDLNAVRAAPVAREPFTYFACRNTLHPADLTRISRDFPRIVGTGIHPLHELTFGPAFQSLVDDLRSAEFGQLMSEKLGVALEGRPLMITVRGYCHRKDGKIHTDSKDKIATILLYLNEQWGNDGANASGCLRLLRSGTDLEDKLAEIPPHGGTMVAFRRSENSYHGFVPCEAKRSDNSWHGHHPFEGQRRYLMCNWLVSDAAHVRHSGRHTLSSKIKRLDPRTWF
ncbi:MAG TPA: 2OG-Fe(II) oxygenase [Hyphomicrobiaceae bacterium]|nr:2OG-Fe(II) oxygenase [Hyphomicrobiaceae bacterium]